MVHIVSLVISLLVVVAIAPMKFFYQELSLAMPSAFSNYI
jgi:hypothetical protein